MSSSEKLRQRFSAVMMDNYGTPPVALTHGEGRTLYDVDGKSYLDMIAGIAVSSLGHHHPAITTAVTEQVNKIAHTSNLFLHEPEIALAEKLVSLTGTRAKVLFTNSGAEANETALKIALLAGSRNGRNYIVAAEESFHGRTLGALAVTGKPAIRDPFGPSIIDVRFVPYGDTDAMRSAVTSECAAIIVEPTQGEAGVIPAPSGYLRAIRDQCDLTGSLFIADEIQSGIGRTGTWFATQAANVTPDIITLAKGLGGGLPIGATISTGDTATILTPGTHGTTFGGNPIATAAALAVINTIEADKLLDHAISVGHYLSAGIRALRHPLVAHVRGSGLWRGIVLTQDRAAALNNALQEAGVLANAVRPHVLRLAPPLTITSDEIDHFLSLLPDTLDQAYTLEDDE